jgi:hypothetical protein
MQNMSEGQVITVEHIAKDGWHEFTCPQVPGFHLISTDEDLEGAYEQVPAAIADLIESDEGAAVDVTLENSYSEYLAKIPETMRPFRHYSVKRVA